LGFGTIFAKIMKEVETLKQEFDILQTTFLPKEELEDTMVTTNVEEWIEFIENCKTDPLTSSDYICDYTIVGNAKAFALAPVFSYMGKVETTGTRLFDSLKELKEFLKNKNYILYVVHCMAVYRSDNPIENNTNPFDPIVSKDHTIAFETITKKPPEIKYTFRGVILD
jgi:hypothetical protein